MTEKEQLTIEDVTYDIRPSPMSLLVTDTEPLTFQEAKARESINQAFTAFDAANPQVYTKLVELAEQAQRSGRRVGIRMLWEVMRWDLTVKVDAGDDFKLNDHYTSRYVRMIQRRRPDLAGLFQTRTLRAP